MHRFFLTTSGPLIPGQAFLLPVHLAHQIRDVLRLKISEQLILFDNSGDELLCSVTASSRTSVEVQLLERLTGKDESLVHIILCQGLLKSARFEWILEKGTEMGVTTFLPIICRRSTSGLEEAGPAKLQRWQRIIQEATEQCGRVRQPALLPIQPLKHALAAIPEGALAIIPWEEEKEQSLHAVLTTVPLPHDPSMPLTVVLFIGPEGGLLPEEVALARRHGVHSVTLGTRILRAETAALATVANVMYELESRH